MTTKPALDLIEKVGIYRGLEREQLRLLAPHADRVLVPAGRTVAEAGRTARELLVVVEGEVEVRRPDGEVERHGPGTHIGTAALAEGQRHATTVTTTADTTFVVVTAQAFRWSVRAIPEVASRLTIPDAVALPVIPVPVRTPQLAVA